MKKLVGLLTAVLLIYSLPLILAGDDKQVVVDLEKYEKATFAGGCFWCVQPPYDKLEGVIKTTVGYTGGKEQNPTYKQVAYGKTSHTESIEIIYDPGVVSYEKLLEVFWMNIDPTDLGGQFVDRGRQYRPEIFYHNENQRIIAETSKAKLNNSGRFEKPVVVPITPASTFWKAEEYHQKYYKKSPVSYYAYRKGSGRDQFIEKHWGM
ncbi:MAG: peptide-methionine (S)-S-oxide reductase MsrA [Candidatus Dadabacteria bacterium]|nr:peptide-methionine (S)-S-oxide reductase MsrA [Candidatus Dadabacteria bacterium]